MTIELDAPATAARLGAAPGDRRRLLGMGGVILALHVLGWEDWRRPSAGIPTAAPLRCSASASG